jgi:hypothetical protein
VEIIIKKDDHLIKLEGECHTPDIFEFAYKWIESVMYLSTYKSLKATILISSRDYFILSTEDMFSLQVFQRLFFHQWEMDAENSTIEGPTYIAAYVRRVKR